MACDFPKHKNIYLIMLIDIIKNSRAIIYTDFCHNIAAPLKKKEKERKKSRYFSAGTLSSTFTDFTFTLKHGAIKCKIQNTGKIATCKINKYEYKYIYKQLFMLIWYVALLLSVLTVFIMYVFIYITCIRHEGYLTLCKRCVNACSIINHLWASLNSLSEHKHVRCSFCSIFAV